METVRLRVCKVCRSDNVREDIMSEDGESYPILVCESCGWWG
jgi:RNase P subunit RPR2